MDTLSKKILSKFGFKRGHKKIEIDPVCSMRVDAVKTELKFQYKGKEYFFCSRVCLDQFKTEPEKYID